jgi:hypothetical protein
MERVGAYLPPDEEEIEEEKSFLYRRKIKNVKEIKWNN